MTKDEIIKLIEDNGLTLHGDIEHFAALVAEHTYTKYLELPEAKQSGTISITMPAPIAYLCENATGHKYFRWKKPLSVYKPIPLYTTPPQPEPVAWMHTKLDGVVVPHQPADLSRHPDRWEALYRTPPPCPTCEALARTVMLDQTSHDTTPPQRTWVGLTDDEYFGLQMKIKTPMISVQDYIDAMRMVEAKLKEKNA